MNRTCRVARLAVTAALCLTIGSAFNGNAKAPGGQDAAGAKQQSTMAKYNAYQAAQAERNPTQQIKLLDDFVSKYPNSALLVYVYPLYYNAYSQLKNWPKVMEYADKLLALNGADPPTRYSAYFARAFAYTNTPQPKGEPDATPKDQAAKACESANPALQTLNDLKKSHAMREDTVNNRIQSPTTRFNS